VIANRILKAAGLDPAKDVSAQKLDLTKTVDGMKDGSIDALFRSGGLPTPGITELPTTSAGKVQFLDVTSLLPSLQTINPVYEKGTIPASTYRTPADIPAIVVPNVLLVRQDLDPNVACVLTKVLFERKEQLAQANAAAKEISLRTARQTAPVPLHRGAVKALDDLGAPNSRLFLSRIRIRLRRAKRIVTVACVLYCLGSPQGARTKGDRDDVPGRQPR
jgi:TRAP transporter TAXI family solute receptor